MEKNWVITQNLSTYLYSYKYLNRNSYFYSYKAGKTNLAVIQICISCIIFFNLNFLPEI